MKRQKWTPEKNEYCFSWAKEGHFGGGIVLSIQYQPNSVLE
jgi:hypothetical protein